MSLFTVSTIVAVILSTFKRKTTTTKNKRIAWILVAVFFVIAVTTMPPVEEKAGEKPKPTPTITKTEDKKKENTSINNSSNRTGCTYARNNIKYGVLPDLINGLAIVEDAIDETESNIDTFTKVSGYTNGSIGTHMSLMAMSYKSMRVALYEYDIEKMAASALLQNKYIDELNILCKSIGK